MLGIVAIFLVSGFLLARVSPGKPSAGVPAATAVASPAPPAADPSPPTPFFASFRGVRLRLPVQASDVTILAFHQASYTDSLAMTSLLARASLGKTARAAKLQRAARTAAKAAKAGKGATDTVVASSSVASSRTAPPTSAPTLVTEAGVFGGPAIQLWRSGRQGKPDTALDCGARPGTAVYSPIDGTVMEIRQYKLYGKYPDIEIHIKPDLFSDVDAVIIHVTDPSVTEGQHVNAGVDRIASVRALAGKVSGLQLTDYTAEGGNHCHLQFNRIKTPGAIWNLGEDPPGSARR